MSWDPPLPYALLLQDDGGQAESDTKQVLRGSLLAKLSQEEIKELKHQKNPGIPPFNFKVLENPNIKLYCNAHAVHLLNSKQKDFLHGIVSVSDRFDVLKKLEWAEKLREKSTVFISIPAFSTAAKGIVHYIGKLPGETGTKFGVELLVCKIIIIKKLVSFYLVNFYTLNSIAVPWIVTTVYIINPTSVIE